MPPRVHDSTFIRRQPFRNGDMQYLEPSFPVSAPDITVAKHVYGPNTAGVQGKGVRCSPRPAVGYYVTVPPQIREVNIKLDISTNLMFINGWCSFSGAVKMSGSLHRSPSRATQHDS